MAEWNPFDPAFNANPYPHYRLLRAEDPVYEHPMGFYILTRYDDVTMLLRDPRFGKRGYEALLTARFGSEENTPGLATSMLFRDPPDHTRLRSLVSKAFTPRVVEALRPRIEAIVADLLDRMRGRPRVDLIEDLAYPLPVAVISEMLGVPREDREAIKQWSDDLARSLDAIAFASDSDVVARGSAAGDGLREYFRALVAERRGKPGADLISALIEAEERGDRLSEAELLSTCTLLYVAGHETTVNLIGNGMLTLLRHPADMATLTRQPSLIQSALEELLRYEGPVQRTGRTCNVDLELRGKKIREGALVVAVLGAANRDPDQFQDPERLDLSRSDNRHLAFGLGIHFCLGAPLARVEGQIAINALLARFPHLTLAHPEPQWRPSITLRGLESLPVTLV
jgi:cytochrome P450